MSHSWNKLDGIMRQFSPRLREDLGLNPEASNSLASTIASEVLTLPREVLRDIRDGDVVGLHQHLATAPR